jgi:hypothetical protein
MECTKYESRSVIVSAAHSSLIEMNKKRKLSRLLLRPVKVDFRNTEVWKWSLGW